MTWSFCSSWRDHWSNYYWLRKILHIHKPPKWSKLFSWTKLINSLSWQGHNLPFRSLLLNNLPSIALSSMSKTLFPSILKSVNNVFISLMEYLSLFFLIYDRDWPTERFTRLRQRPKSSEVLKPLDVTVGKNRLYQKEGRPQCGRSLWSGRRRYATGLPSVGS